MLTLANAELTVDLIDPAVEQARLGPRYCWGGYIWQVQDRSIGTLVCVNMLLFAGEVRRVLAPGGALVWVNSIGERTPIHLSADAVAAALGDGVTVTASRCGWGT